MSIDLQSLYGWMYTRLESDAAGAAVRALARIIPAHDLDLDALPVAPFAAFRQGAVGGMTDQMRIPSATWWVYDAPTKGTWWINGITAAIEDAYPRLARPDGEFSVGIGQPIEDTALNMTGCPVTLYFYRR